MSLVVLQVETISAYFRSAQKIPCGAFHSMGQNSGKVFEPVQNLKSKTLSRTIKNVWPASGHRVHQKQEYTACSAQMQFVEPSPKSFLFQHGYICVPCRVGQHHSMIVQRHSSETLKVDFCSWTVVLRWAWTGAEQLHGTHCIFLQKQDAGSFWTWHQNQQATSAIAYNLSRASSHRSCQIFAYVRCQSSVSSGSPTHQP